VSTANHRALVWNLNLREDSSSGAIEHSLQGHSRAITDINFSAHHPDLLATCAVDGYVHCWDLRRPRQPALSFCDWFAGATQVKYNRQDQHILASSHDRWLHIWDERKASEPLKSISAHTSKIYGLDWNRTRPTGVVTCSLDKSIKFWDYGHDNDVPERVIRTEFPVWRARHAPFGWGLLAMPQNEPGDLYLYDRRLHHDTPIDGAIEPVATFTGHGNHKVKEFLWRTRGSIGEDRLDNREFQLVSWGEDNELRLQKLDPEIFKSVGYTRGLEARRNLNITRKGATYKTFRTAEDLATRDKRSATMSDTRPSTGGTAFRQSALTLGMRSTPPHYHRPGATWRGSAMRAKVANRKEMDRSQVQIGWMKGVTMTKRKSSSDTPKRAGSKDSATFSPGYPEDVWGDPETIHEEFLRLNTELPKVKWEHIDMDALTLNASLNGPWGAGGESIFIKVKVDIPANYPKSRAPKFIIEKTPFLPEDTHKRIEHEIHQLANQFLERKQNCLHVAFTYLLGEVDLEHSTSFFKNVRDLDDDLDGLADESSTDEDDNGIPAGGSAAMSQELSPGVEANNGALAAINRPVIPPRLCGGRFSNDGRLVCFFPTKEEKAKALLFSPVEAYRERPKGEPVFAGFGRITHDASPRQRYTTDETSATDDPSGTDESGGSSTSSDSESTSMRKINLWYQPGRRFRKTWSEDRSLRSSGGGTGAGTGTGTGASRRRPAKAKSTLSIHDIRSELPSKREFAQEYAIFGDGADVCEHNARVAEKYGYADLVDVWRYSALLLRKDIPLELLDLDQRKNSILVIARDVVSRFRDDRSSESDSHSASDDMNLSGRVKWGNHPLAKEFIQDLFDYFERLADIQMLAMLSCIFSESTTEDGVAYAESHLSQPETPLPMKAPSFSLDYFPTDASLWNIHLRSHSNSAITTPRTLNTPIHYSGSQASEEGLWAGDPGSNSYSCGETPPLKTGREYLAEIESTQTLSTSPDNRGLRRANSGLAASLASNFPRFSSSPPNPPQPSKKKSSPAETVPANLAPANMSSITWGGSTVLGDSAGTARTSVSDDDIRREDFLPLIATSVAVTMEDQTMFDDDGWMTTPLLEPSKDAMYASYRYSYAEMLQMWHRPLARLEIMKFNVLKEDISGGHLESSIHDSLNDTSTIVSHHPPSASSPIILGKKEQLQAVMLSGRGLDVTGICRTHETQLESLRYTSSGSFRMGGAVGACDRCKKTQTQLKCVYCLEPVDALYPPCLNCGCASHDACLAEWHAAGEVFCPAGDECKCVEEAANGQVETWTAMMGALERIRRGHAHGKGLARSLGARDTLDDSDEERDEKGDWESLASSTGTPSRTLGTIVSPAKLSLGNRLKKSAGNWSRASSLRRPHGGSGGSAGGWKRSG
jgi:WD repeat-containing protein 59